MNTSIYGIAFDKSKNVKPCVGELYNPDATKDFTLRDESSFQFIDFWPKWNDKLPEPHIRAWKATIEAGTHALYMRLIPVVLVPQKQLEFLGVWSLLDDEWRKLVTEEETRIANGEAAKLTEVHARMEKARSSRRKRYDHIPEQMTCTQCKQPITINKAQVAKKMESQSISLETFIKEFKCTVCCPPQRGKRANPEYANIPKELTCSKCGTKVKTAPSNIAARAKLKGIPVEQFLAEFMCQVCNPTKGKGRRKGSGKTGYYGSVQKMVCVQCNSVHSAITSQLEKRVKKLGMTIEQFLKQYRCQICFPTKGRKKNKGKKLHALV